MGTALPLDGRWDYNELTDGEYLALGHYRESAIVTYRGLVFISPWFEVIPAYYHHHLQLLYNAITWSRYQKPEHELGVSLEAPPALKPGSSTTLNVTVSNLGLKNETNIQLILLIDDNPVCNITIPQLTNGSSHTHSHLWSPTREGKYNVTAYAPPITGEETLSNNAESADVLVYTTLVALFKNVDPWDYTANEELLSENHIPYVVLKSEDFRSIKLNTFAKVVICSDQDQPFYNAIEEHRGWFEDYANNGGLLEIHAADLGWHGGQWIGLLPGGLEYIPISSDMVTVADPEHPVLNVPHRITSEEL
ncbi:hypothetical protein GWM83_02190, partial [Candidatus Bathyarchaeota archaeon]|nr:hypothetical protein [Candidatus Bathyarchaeota archaeon]NIW34357.1 hypothetical protein [Candidatus Bathyarchaeota archaeon]